jgi:hypothetical protein
MSMSEVACTDVRTPLHSRPKPLPSSAVDFGYPPCGRSSPGGTQQLLANQSPLQERAQCFPVGQADKEPANPDRDLGISGRRCPRQMQRLLVLIQSLQEVQDARAPGSRRAIPDESSRFIYGRLREDAQGPLWRPRVVKVGQGLPAGDRAHLARGSGSDRACDTHPTQSLLRSHAGFRHSPSAMTDQGRKALPEAKGISQRDGCGARDRRSECGG